MKAEAGDLDSPEKRGKYTFCVVGCGRIGLSAACLFADAGFRIICTDFNQQVINLLKKGKAPFSEPELSRLVKKHVRTGRLTLTTDNKKAVAESDIIMIALQTVVDDKKKPDYSSVEKACKEVGVGLRVGSLVIFAGTTEPSITEILIQGALENASGLKAGVDFCLVHSPIYATPGRIINDLTTHTWVVGAINELSFKVANFVLNTFVKGGTVRVRDVKTSEALKLFENVQSHVNLALANDFALLCEKIGIDYFEVQKVTSMHFHCNLLLPNIAGGCVSDEQYFLLEEAENAGTKLRLSELAIRINDEMLEHLVQLVKDVLKKSGKTFRRARIVLFGLSCLANVKDPSITKTKELVNLLTRKGASVRLFDPLYSYAELHELGFSVERTLTKTVEGADCLVFLIGHNGFKRLNLRKIKFLMRNAAVVDVDNVISPEKAKKEGFIYRGLGRGSDTE
jgi:nucleotide sugar dehydrogenase